MAEPDGPIRTCIGCREREPRDTLVRYVLELADGAPARVVRDHERRRAGRGAWLHDRERCLELADQRRAFRRAFRIHGDVAIHVDQQDHDGAGHVTSPD